MKKEEKTFTCELCGRECPEHVLSEHHLVPASKGGKKGETVMLCVCHDQIHKLFTNNELRDEYNTLEKLKANEKIQKWIKYIRKQKDFSVCMKTKKRR